MIGVRLRLLKKIVAFGRVCHQRHNTKEGSRAMERKKDGFCEERRSFLKGAVVGTTLLAAEFSPLGSIARATNEKTLIKLPPLPYGQNALAPYISSGTVAFHYNFHHQGYVDKVNKLVQGTSMAGVSLEDIVKETQGKADKSDLFNNAAQVWNHNFYWKSMKPGGGGVPSGGLAKKIEASFGSFEKFRESFANAAGSLFGSGWVWLVKADDSLKVVQTLNADTPIVHGMLPLATLDVWEHAYYLDYQNRRKDYINLFLDHLINWDFVSRNLS